MQNMWTDNSSTAYSSAEAVKQERIFMIYCCYISKVARSIMWSLSHAHAFEQRQIAFDNDQVFHLLWIERRSLGSHHISSGWKHSFRFWTCRWHWKDDPDQVRKECQIYSPAVLIYATQNPTRTRPGTRTFNHYPTRTRPEVKKCYPSGPAPPQSCGRTRGATSYKQGHENNCHSGFKDGQVFNWGGL